MLIPARSQDPSARPLAPSSVRTALRGIAGDLARQGLADETNRLKQLMVRLGDAPEDLEVFAQKWDRYLERPSPDPKRQSKIVDALRRQADKLTKGLERREEPGRRVLANLVLELDSQNAVANELIGNQLSDGRWWTPGDAVLHARAKQVGDFVRRAQSLPVEIESGVSDSRLLKSIYGRECSVVRARGVELHSPLPVTELERILRQVLRAAALSNALLAGRLEIPEHLHARRLLLLDSARAFETALKEARDNGGITDQMYESHRIQKWWGISDSRGWQTLRWVPEAELEAAALFYISVDWLDRDDQPCLRAGHLNWLCLNVLGTSLPSIAWREDPQAGRQRTKVLEGRVFANEPLWRSARRSLYGCRSGMERMVTEHRDPPWSNSMADEIGKIQDEELFKTTLVVAYLQQSGALTNLLKATHSEREDRAALFEEALGEPLPEFERAWAHWLLGNAAQAGLVQQLQQQPSEAAPDGVRASMLELLNRIRSRALAGQYAEVEAVQEDPELSADALAHAHYLTLHPKQMESWPAAHEEYAGLEGFSVGGARAGLRSVIAPGREPEESIHTWMGTFYHRLPLLEPGLFGVGMGLDPQVVVLEVSSLVAEPWQEHWVAWPPNGETDVPLSFVPEIPNPVPGMDQKRFGYPITLQVRLPSREGSIDLELRLNRDTPAGPEVDCYHLSPRDYFFAECVPENAWCLIPKRDLDPNTQYSVTVRGNRTGSRQWSFQTGGR